MAATETDIFPEPSERLLVTLAEQLKLPWVQLARLAELSKRNGDRTQLDKLYAQIEVNSQSSMHLIDGYLLSTQSYFGQTNFDLEPVSITSLSYDVLHKLEGYAKEYDCSLEFEVNGKPRAVMAYRRGLESALMNLGYSFIEAAAAQSSDRPLKLVISRRAATVSAGMYGIKEGLNRQMLRHAKQLYGFARQPLRTFTSASGAGVFIADSLLSSMNSPLKASIHQRSQGLAAVFQPSRQLSLV